MYCEFVAQLYGLGICIHAPAILGALVNVKSMSVIFLPPPGYICCLLHWCCFWIAQMPACCWRIQSISNVYPRVAGNEKEMFPREYRKLTNGHLKPRLQDLCSSKWQNKEYILVSFMGRATGEDWFIPMEKELRFIQKKDILINNINNVLLQDASDPGGEYSCVLIWCYYGQLKTPIRAEHRKPH